MKRVLPKFCADQSYVRGVNRRSKFPKNSFLNEVISRNELAKLQTSVYPSNIAPIGAKLWQNAFHDGLQLSIFRRQKKFCRPNFKRPFTPPTWLRSARNFGKTRFRRFASFDFATLNFFFGKKIVKGSIFFQQSGVLEAL